VSSQTSHFSGQEKTIGVLSLPKNGLQKMPLVFGHIRSQAAILENKRKGGRYYSQRQQQHPIYSESIINTGIVCKKNCLMELFGVKNMVLHCFGWRPEVGEGASAKAIQRGLLHSIGNPPQIKLTSCHHNEKLFPRRDK